MKWFGSRGGRQGERGGEEKFVGKWCGHPLESLGGLKVIRCVKVGKAQEPLRYIEVLIVLAP